MTDLRLSLFGGFAMERAGKPLQAFESDKARALLAYLAVEVGRPHRRERLAGLFWPEVPESRARHSLSQVLSSLKVLFQADPGISPLEITSQEVRFLSEGCWLDLQEFDVLLSACEAHGHPPEWPCRPCLERLERAAALHQGDFLAGFTLAGCAAFEEWLLVQQEAYRQKIIQVLGRLSQGWETLGEVEKALAYATRQVAIDPLDEAAHRQVMRLLARQGRRTEALAQYAACQKILADELGVPPEAETERLYQQILEESEGQARTSFRHNLPFPLTRLVGRQVELDQITLKLAEPVCRLVTILGTGGTGKSRLALEAGHHLLPAFPDGVFLVELDTQTPHQPLAQLIARAVGLERRPESAAFGFSGRTNVDQMLGQLFTDLSEKKLLLILDGFEGLLHEAGLVGSLLRRAPLVKILVTSRARLSLEAERIFLLEGLSYPQQVSLTDLEDYSAVQLFVEAAHRRRPEFQLSESNHQAVAEICRLTQGFPLAILLAASWIGILDPAQILREIRHSLDFLASDWHDLPDRQRSLRATFDHSWQLLSEAEKNVFLRLALFHAPFTAERASQVAGASLHNLRTLTDQSLLMPASGDRYRLHDLLRQYAQEKLAALPAENLAAHERYSQVYLAALAAWEPRLMCREQPAALAEIDQEYADILAAWEWALAHLRLELLEKAFGGMSYYHHVRGLPAMKAELCQKALQALESQGLIADNQRLWLILATRLAEALTIQNEFDRVAPTIRQIEARLQEWGEQSAGMQREIAFFHLVKGYAIWFSGGNRQQALESDQRGLELMYACGDPNDISIALDWVATMHGQVGNLRETNRYAREALAIQQSLDNPYSLGAIYENLSFSAMLLGDNQAAQWPMQERIQGLLRNGGRQERALAAYCEGMSLFYAGQYEQARSQCEKGILLFVLPAQIQWRNFLQSILKCIDLHMGNYPAVFEETVFPGEPLPKSMFADFDLPKASVRLLQANEAVSSGKNTYHDADIERLFSQAQQELMNYLGLVTSLPRLDMVGQPLALLGHIAYRRELFNEARQYLEDALENGLKQGFFWVFMLALSVIALILAEAGDLEQAVELYATVTAHPCAGNSRWFEDMFGRRLSALSASLPVETITTAQARGRLRELSAAGQEYLDRLRSSPSFLSPPPLPRETP